MTQDRAFQQCRFIFPIALPFGAFSSGFNSRGCRWLFFGIGRKLQMADEGASSFEVEKSKSSDELGLESSNNDDESDSSCTGEDNTKDEDGSDCCKSTRTDSLRANFENVLSIKGEDNVIDRKEYLLQQIVHPSSKPR